jgi:CHAD domain-containing protein
LHRKQPVPDAAGCVLREAFDQFTANLEALRTSEEPEVVHQARVGWRRFKSALWLFKPVLAPPAMAPWQDLQPLLHGLGELRNLDVALHDTLPPLADAYTAGAPRRMAAWQALTGALALAGQQQRKAVRTTRQHPAIRAALRATAQWLQQLPPEPTPEQASKKQHEELRHWARQRLTQLHDRLETAQKTAADAEGQHRVRILAKRMRYSIEALRPLLPAQRTQRWYQQATALQTRLGAARDVAQASVLVEPWDVEGGLTEFLRGVAVGQLGTTPTQRTPKP